MAIGVGGGGGNAINHLYAHGERNISFMLCNTDRQALINSPIPETGKILLGKDGLGAGNQAAIGKQYATDSIDNIKSLLSESGIRMVFVVAGMGGGTGTGASPVIAAAAKDLGILTIGVVTIPFESEGRPRLAQAVAGVDELSKNVDSLIIINNSHIVEIYGDLSLSKAYYQSNDIISKAVKSISDIITKHFVVNVDFADVCRVMRNSGVALMGTGVASGEGRALEATKQALSSPLLHMQDITGSENVLVCITSSSRPEYELRMSDARDVPAFIQQQTRMQNETDVIWGAGYDDTLEDKIQVIVVATGFNLHNIPSMRTYYGLESADETIDSSSQVTRIEIDANDNIVHSRSNLYKKKPEPIREPLQPVRISSHTIQRSINTNKSCSISAMESSASDQNPENRVRPSSVAGTVSVDDSSGCVVENNVQIYYDVDDNRPAFMRRQLPIGISRHQHKKKESLIIEEEKSQQPVMTTGSLFDDL